MKNLKTTLCITLAAILALSILTPLTAAARQPRTIDFSPWEQGGPVLSVSNATNKEFFTTHYYPDGLVVDMTQISVSVYQSQADRGRNAIGLLESDFSYEETGRLGYLDGRVIFANAPATITFPRDGFPVWDLIGDSIIGYQLYRVSSDPNDIVDVLLLRRPRDRDTEERIPFTTGGSQLYAVGQIGVGEGEWCRDEFRWIYEEYVEANAYMVPAGSSYVLDAGIYSINTWFSHLGPLFIVVGGGDSLVAGGATSTPRPTPAPQRDITVLIDDTPVVFDVAPITRGGRTLVPLGAIADALGADATWSSAARRVVLYRDGITITMFIDNPDVQVDGNTITLDVAPTMVDNRTLVPLRAITDFFGYDARWDGATRTAYITTR